MSGRKVLVVGFGVTGRAVGRVLAEGGDDVTVFDDAPPPGAAARAEALGVALRTTPPQSELEAAVARSELVVPSPGVPVHHPVFAAAAAAGIPVRSEIELAARQARERGEPELVAITGTNGKTTVTTLVTAMLEASGRRAVAAGNIGAPLIEAVASGHEVVVSEVSSFQLQFTDSFRPGVSCWLNLAQDHLDWHPSLEHYGAAKARIWANQGAGDTAVVNADDPRVSAAAGRIPDGVARRTFSVEVPAGFHVEGDRLVTPDGAVLIPVSELPRAFPHDVANALAAAATAIAAGASMHGCRVALARHVPLPHRVSHVGEAAGVGWYDDSKATTPASVLAAVRGFPSVVLIAGGRNKGLDLRALREAVPPVRAVVAIGEATDELISALGDLVEVTLAESMEAAVAVAHAVAVPGDAVLLSPGCASFDWYPSYAARGDHFTSVVARLLTRGVQQC
jgi:UDP-N-acetylmuramoylalanine--D-glutamate ligase